MKAKRSSIIKFYEMEDKETSALKKYKQITVANGSYRHLFLYEILQLCFSNMAGAVGILLRQKLYRPLFKEMGKKVIIGRGVCLRQAKKISLGTGAMLDDYSRVSVLGAEQAVIRIGCHSLLGPFSVCNARNGQIEIGDDVTIGSHCRIGSMNGKISIQRYTMIGAYTYIGAGNHGTEDLTKPMMFQESASQGGVCIKENVWIGGNVVVLDGVTIGENSVIGACSLVNKDIPPCSIAYGTPARVQKTVSCRRTQKK
jgi:galactoside O-acetyltransferase